MTEIVVPLGEYVAIVGFSIHRVTLEKELCKGSTIVIPSCSGVVSEITHEHDHATPYYTPRTGRGKFVLTINDDEFLLFSVKDSRVQNLV